MAGARRAAKRDDTPGTVLILFHEMVNPINFLKFAKVRLQGHRIKLQ
jgi:hypothetical protein